jgi:hypothetical protein
LDESKLPAGLIAKLYAVKLKIGEKVVVEVEYDK